MDLDIVKKARVVDDVSVNIHLEIYLFCHIFTYFPQKKNILCFPLLLGVIVANGLEKRVKYQL